MTRPRFRSVALVLVGSLVAVSVCGALYEAVASARDARISPPGVLVDVGGRRIHVLCIGAGNPTVIFDPGFGSRAVSFPFLRATLAKMTRVCSYDRMGTGWSDPGPTAAPADVLAEDLRRLQEGAALTPPFVIVAGSIGGVEAEMFARRYPERVAGLVMLDAANSEVLGAVTSIVDATTLAEVRAMCGVIRAASPIGIVRLIASPPGRWSTVCAIVRGIPETLEEFAQASPLRADLPLVVLTAETGENLFPGGPFVPPRLKKLARETRARLTMSQQHLAARSTQGSWRMVPGSNHVIAESRPQAVLDAVRSVLADVRGR